MSHNKSTLLEKGLNDIDAL